MRNKRYVPGILASMLGKLSPPPLTKKQEEIVESRERLHYLAHNHFQPLDLNPLSAPKQIQLPPPLQKLNIGK